MANVYRIGVNIAMTSNGPQLLSLLSRELLGVHAHVKDLQGGFSRLKLAIGGALAIGGGFAILGAFKAPLDEARKFEMAMTKFGNFGLGPERTREASEFAKAMNIAGSTYTENMKRMTEAQGVFRESGLAGDAALRGAKMAAPTLAKIDFATSALDDESRAKMHSSALSMLRFIEMRGGVKSPEAFNAIANLGFKAIQSSGGNIDWEQLRQFMARGGVAAQGIRDDVLFGKLEPVIGELKGSTAGNAWMTAYNRLQGIVRVPNQVAHELAKSGIWDGSKIEWNSQGGIKRFLGNPLQNAADWQTDPVAAYQKYILPMYGRMGLDQNGRNRENALIFGRTGGAFFSLIDRQQAAIANSVDSQRKALGINDAYKAAGGTLNGKIVDLQAKYVNLQERLGEAVLPLAVKGLEHLIPLLTKITDWIGRNPGKVEFFAKVAVGVAAGLIALGAAAIGVAVFAGGWVGAVVVGIGALVGAFATWAAFSWDTLKTAASAIGDFVGRLFQIASYIFQHPLTWMLPKGMRDATGAEIAQDPKNLHPGSRVLDLTPGAVANTRAPRQLTPGDMKSFFAAPKSAAPSQPITPTKSSFTGDVHMDGEKVGQVVWRHQSAALDRAALSGSGNYDPSMSLAPTGLSYA